MAWVVDRSLNVLLAQIDAAAPNRDRSSDGSIGDEGHAATVSAHNPQDTADSSDGNDPDGQVDARDITHDPRFAGSDMAQVTEAIRQSKDRRVRLIIFNKRIFASYATASRPAWTWGPYSGDNDHSKHAHVETNDLHNDELAPWKISLAPIPTEEDDMIGFAKDDKGDLRKSVGGFTFPCTPQEMGDIRSLSAQGILGPASSKVHPNDATGTAFGYPVERLIDDIAKRVLALIPPGAGGACPSVEQIADAVMDEHATRLAG